MIVELKTIKLMPGSKDLGIIRCMALTTFDDQVVGLIWRRRWLRQIIIPSVVQ